MSVRWQDEKLSYAIDGGRVIGQVWHGSEGWLWEHHTSEVDGICATEAEARDALLNEDIFWADLARKEGVE